MKRLIVVGEGPTEEYFIKEVLAPHLLNASKMKISAEARVHKPGPTNERARRGGVGTYKKIKNELIKFCKEDTTATVTTMFDYYGLPKDTPGINTATGTIFDKAQYIESAVQEDIGNLQNLIFNLTLHEFEGLLFSDISAFEGMTDNRSIEELQKIRDGFETPEHINDDYDTAPSKRIKKIIDTYAKTADGLMIAKSIGIDNISSQCPHFKNWISKLMLLAN